MLTPSPKNVYRTVDKVKTRGDMSVAEVATLIGVPLSSLKKAMFDGPNHRELHPSAWILLQLLADEHPHYRLRHRGSPIKR